QRRVRRLHGSAFGPARAGVDGPLYRGRRGAGWGGGGEGASGAGSHGLGDVPPQVARGATPSPSLHHPPPTAMKRCAVAARRWPGRGALGGGPRGAPGTKLPPVTSGGTGRSSGGDTSRFTVRRLRSAFFLWRTSIRSTDLLIALVFVALSLGLG